MPFQDYYAAIEEIDPSLSREENLARLRKVAHTWKRDPPVNGGETKRTIASAIETFSSEKLYDAFRKWWEAQEAHVSAPHASEEPAPASVEQRDSAHQDTIFIEGMASALKEVKHSVLELRQLFEARIDRDEGKSKLIEAVVSRLEKYERDFVFNQFQKQIFLDLIGLFDRIEVLRDRPTLGAEFRIDLESLGREVLQILGHQGVFPMENTPSQFDETLQEAVDTVEVYDPEQDKTVTEAARKGFVYQERVLRPEMVVVAKYVKKGDQDD